MLKGCRPADPAFYDMPQGTQKSSTLAFIAVVIVVVALLLMAS
jgi:hypothetical protein